MYYTIVCHIMVCICMCVYIYIYAFTKKLLVISFLVVLGFPLQRALGSKGLAGLVQFDKQRP